MGSEKDTFSFKYMLLSTKDKLSTDYVKPRIVKAAEFDIKKRVNEVYGKKLNIDMLKKNALIFLFNASFNSNADLLDYICKAYKENHPKFENVYDCVAMFAEGHNAEAFGFLSWKDSKKRSEGKDEYTIEKLIPIIYGKDYHEVEVSVKFVDLCYPKRLVNNIIENKLDTITPENKEYTMDLISTIKSILINKYNKGCDGIPDDIKKIHGVSKITDENSVSISSLLDSYVLGKNYYSPMYYDVLSAIMIIERTHNVAKTFGEKYDVKKATVNGKKLTSLTLSFLSVLSSTEYIKSAQDRAKTKDNLIEQQRNDLYEEIGQQVINEYNETHFTNITIDQVKFFPGENQEIIQETNRRYLEFINGNHR